MFFCFIHRLYSIF